MGAAPRSELSPASHRPIQPAADRELRIGSLEPSTVEANCCRTRFTPTAERRLPGGGGVLYSPACGLRCRLEFLQMRLCQVRLFQLQIETRQEKMNLGITGAEFWQRQRSFSFERSILEISLML